MKPESMDALFAALANQHRRRILDLVKESPGCSVGDVSAHFDISRIGVLKHLRVLEDSGLLVSRKRGRTRELYINAVPIQMIHDRWTSEYSALWAERLTNLKYRIEQEAS